MSARRRRRLCVRMHPTCHRYGPRHGPGQEPARRRRCGGRLTLRLVESRRRHRRRILSRMLHNEIRCLQPGIQAQENSNGGAAARQNRRRRGCHGAPDVILPLCSAPTAPSRRGRSRRPRRWCHRNAEVLAFTCQ